MCKVCGETFNEEWIEQVESQHLQSPCDAVAPKESEGTGWVPKGQLIALFLGSILTGELA